ncbi:MAG: transposase [Candidatus Xenobium sp.]|jgi:transposase-like protein
MKKGKKRPGYTKDFRERAVQLSVDSDQTLAEVAAELASRPALYPDGGRSRGGHPTGG